MKKLKITLVDDHQMFRDGVKSVLADENWIDLIGEMGNAQDLYKFLESNNPDLIITDISMPDISGIELTEYISKAYPDIKVLILSMHSNEEYIAKALEAGAHGYLPKDASMSELLEAIETIGKGGKYFNQEISDKILKSFVSRSHEGNQASRHESLTKREMEIVRLIVDGLTNKEIADNLCISIRTVDSHKNNIMHKLQLKSSIDLVKYAIKNNLASL